MFVKLPSGDSFQSPITIEFPQSNPTDVILPLKINILLPAFLYPLLGGSPGTDRTIG